MSLRKRKSVWWVDVRAPNGERIRRSTGAESKALAEEYHDRLKAELWRQSKLSEKPRRVWDDAVVKWLKEQAHKATINEDVARFRWLDRYLRGKPLDTIDRAVVDKIMDAKLAEGVRNATANRLLELVRAVLRKCVNDWEWIDKAPSVRMLKEPSRRIRYLTREEAQKLLQELPEHMADMAAFSLATGLRQANVTGLEWPQIDLARRLAWIHADQAKARRAIPVPSMLRLSRLSASSSGTIRRMCSVSGVSQSRKSALKLGGTGSCRHHRFRWHDLRHTWASWHVQNGTPLFALQELGG